MAKVSSLETLHGTVGDLVYYTLNGVQVVRRKSGFNKKSYENSESYKAVRDNSSEFGHCSKLGKNIRLALAPYTQVAQDKYLYQKFAKIMTQIKDLDTENTKGKRTVLEGLQTEKGKQVLRSFVFGEIPPLNGSVELQNDLFGMQIATHKTPAKTLELYALTLTKDSVEIKCQTSSHTLPTSAIEVEQGNVQTFTIYFAGLKKGEKIISAGFL